MNLNVLKTIGSGAGVLGGAGVTVGVLHEHYVSKDAKKHDGALPTTSDLVVAGAAGVLTGGVTGGFLGHAIGHHTAPPAAGADLAKFKHIGRVSTGSGIAMGAVLMGTFALGAALGADFLD
ncbi:MAG: hypothetical protein JWO69_1243 [Thermoleophilia bacterium]|jgi:hypothetical protein|nr:hypothetical protein [Thermoleophilia bacterium]